MKKVLRLTAQLYEVKSKRDGGGRIILDFGADSLEAVLDLQRMNSAGDVNLALAIVPYRDNPKEMDVDPRTGEILIQTEESIAPEEHHEFPDTSPSDDSEPA